MSAFNRRQLIALAGAGLARGQQDVREILARELKRSEPDYVCYVPGHWDGSTHDGLNEHFLVFDGPDGSLMAIWTQSDKASGLRGGRQKNRIRFARSTDEGVTWTKPVHVAGPKTQDDPEHMASWAFPLVSKRGRIYVVYNRNIGVQGWIEMHTGRMGAVYSDDGGGTWSAAQEVPMPRSPFDDPEGKIPAEWIVWQLPMRDLKGRWFAGYSHWLHPSKAGWKKTESWTQIESVVEFMRFENVDANPEPRDLKIRYSGWGGQALRVPYWRDPTLSVAQEPSIVRLPDKRLFSVMRTNSGMIWYSVSADDGETWSNPAPLLRKDHGRPILEPVSCCPIYPLADGRYVLLHHNHRGYFDKSPEQSNEPRHPAFIALAEFRPKAHQPLWFSESKLFMDTGGISVDGQAGTMNTGIGLYSSFTTRKGNDVLWHPDRKFFLVGKKVTAGFLAGLDVPRMVTTQVARSQNPEVRIQESE